MRLPIPTRLVLTLFCALALAAAPLFAAETALDQLKRKVVHNYAAIACAEYTDAADAAEKLRASLRAFVAKPSAESLADAKKTWIAARKPYLQTETFRYYAGPIDDDDGPEPMLNSWPMDEAYIETPAGSADLGIIGNEKDHPEITAEVIENLNQRDGEKNISCGYHAIEFLLWGRDLSEKGPGERSVTDYTTAPFAKRRGEYLLACAELLVRDLRYVADDWLPDKLGNYRAIFEEGVEASVQHILTGMALLSGFELAGERLQVAYDTQEQEEEHSCFSDTTHLDVIYDATGIANLWRGAYQTTSGAAISGPGVRELAEALDKPLAQKLGALIDASVEKARAIPPPFDQAIKGADEAPPRKAVYALIIVLEDESEMLRELARKLGYELPKSDEINSEG